MRNEWQRYLFEDCMDAIIDYRGKTPKKTNSGIPLITAKIIKDGAIQQVNEFIAEEDYESWMRRGIPEPGDVVLTTEAPLGEVAQLDNRKIALAQRVITLRGKKGFLDNTFLKYLLLSSDVQHQLDGRGTGTTVKGIKQSELRKLELPIPEYETQKSIAHIIGSLDNKIQLNRQTNQTLEKMAQVLFKSWFVDFDPVIDNALEAGNPIPEELQDRVERKQQLAKPDHKPLPEDVRQLFPSEFELTEDLGWVPKGWGVGSLFKSIELVGGGTPKTRTEEYWGGDIPWFSVVDAPNDSDVFVINTEKNITLAGVDNSSTNILRKGTTIISARGTVGKCALVAKPMAMNQSCYGIQGKKNFTDEYVYYLIRYRVSELQQRGHGSVFNTITRDTFESICSPLPPESVMAEFSVIVKPMFEKILAGGYQTLELAKLRDALLPKLISGELRLPSETLQDVEHQPAETIA